MAKLRAIREAVLVKCRTTPVQFCSLCAFTAALVSRLVPLRIAASTAFEPNLKSLPDDAIAPCCGFAITHCGYRTCSRHSAFMQKTCHDLLHDHDQMGSLIT